MTYVSRKTRIIISRWLDECDAEYTLRACRRRSDARLKRHASCDDFRAWVNDNCIKHEHFVDLMSDGEFLGKPPFRLYGRFIPVPILFKLTAKTTLTAREDERDEATGGKKTGVRNSNSETNKSQYSGSLGRRVSSNTVQVKRSNSYNRSQDSKLEPKGSFTRLEWEKSQLEKRLCECTCLLSKAVGQLEKIDSIVGCSRDEIESYREEQIRTAFYKSRLMCSCPPRNNASETLSPSRSYVKKLRESAKCAELLRKISGLRERLKKIQECHQEISQQIRLSQLRAETCGSSHQVTELYSRREQAHVKRLQKKLEKLIAERGRLLLEMCQTLTCLNSIKKSSRSSMNFSKRRSKTNRNSNEFQNEKPREMLECCCGCTRSEHIESTDSEQVRYSGSSSGENEFNAGYDKCRNLDTELDNDYEANCLETPYAGEFADDETFDSEHSDDENAKNGKTQRRPTPFYQVVNTKTVGLISSQAQKNSKTLSKEENSSEGGGAAKAADESKATKKSRVQFECPESSCKRILNADDLSAYESSLDPAQQALILGAIKNIQNRRPTTSPTTKRERDAVAVEQNRTGGYNAQRISSGEYIPERQIKSETTMKEIEKTLRNYEQRLSRLDSLECKIQELKQKSSEAVRFKQNLERFKSEAKRRNAAEREKSNREITKLCSENWELRRQVQQLTEKFEAQCKKISNLKCSVAKARELECEAEELKKELSEYRDSYEHQRKCISKWESVVAVQRTEIENLMNHIRKLTTKREEAACNAYQTKKCVQRSRSYSPDVKTKGTANRTKASTRNYRLSSEEEDSPYYCNEYLEEEGRRRIQQRSCDRVYCCSPPTRGMEWCN